MWKNALYSLLLLFASSAVIAQVSGRIIDSKTRIGLEFATISINEQLGLTSDTDGYFFISGEIENLHEFRVSFVGYKSKLVKISGETLNLLVTLEPEIQNVEEIVIKISGFPESISQSTGTVSSLTQQNLQIHNGIVLNDAINQVPGVYMSGGGYNTNRLTIRGIGSRSPYSSNRIRAFLDDIPLTTGDGITSIEDIDIAAISRIEVLKGPSSALYGSGLGGVIRMSTYQPENENFSIGLSSEMASFGTFRSAITTGYKSANGSVSLVYANSHSNGYRQNSNYSRNSILITANRNFNRTVLKLTMLYTDVEAQIPSSLTWNNFISDPKTAAPNWLAVKGFEQYYKLLLGITAETELSSGISNKISVFGSFSDPYESRPFNILDEYSRYSGIRENISFKAKNLEILTGGEVFLENYNSKVFETNNGYQGNLLANNREKRFYLNVFTLAKLKATKNLTSELGLNLNILNYSLIDNFNGDSLNLSGKFSYSPVISPRLGINYRLSTDMNMHTSLGHGFSAPSFEETLLPDGQINPNLKPESGWNYDLGIRGKVFNKNVNYDITFYHIDLRNLLVTKRLSESVFTGINAGKTSHTGLEFMTRINLLSPEISSKSEFSITTSFTVSKNRFKIFSDNNIDFSGNNLPGIPSAILYNELRLKFIKVLEVVVINKYTGKQFMNDSNTKDYQSWNVTDLRLSYSTHFDLKNHYFKFYAGVKNLFNTNFAGMILVNAPSFGSAEPRYYYPGLPRNYSVGLVFQFK